MQTMSAPLLILKLGSTLPALADRLGDFEDWIAQALAPAGLPVSTLNAQRNPELPQPSALAGVILTGSNRMVTDREAWSERLRPWLRQLVAQEVPLLALCYGHQLLADAFDGEVQARPQGPEIGTVAIRRLPASDSDPLLHGLPRSFPAHTVHWQSVARIPPQATLLASSDADPHQAYRIGECAWGLQFHPEFSAEAMRFHLQHFRSALHDAGQDTDALLQAVETTTEATGLLLRFAELCRKRLHDREQ